MSKASLLISSVSVAALIGALAYWMMTGEDEMAPAPAIDRAAQSAHPKAIASQWQWDNFAKEGSTIEPVAARKDQEESEAEPDDVVPFDVILIYNILQDIHLDENGRVVPDQMAKYALERGFDDLGPDVSPEALSELQNLIRIGLPGDAGEEAIRIMTAYYEYRLAEEDLNRDVQELAADENETAQPPSIDSYEQLVQLRRRYLGDEIADGLFAVEELQARHMFSVMALQQDADLDEDEKERQLQALQDRLTNRLLALGELTPEEAAAQEVERLRESGASSVDIYLAREAILGPVKAQELATADREEAQWQKHFEGFWKERQNIMKASLDEAEREHQVEQLLGQYFNPDEQERARFTSSEWQSRERQ